MGEKVSRTRCWREEAAEAAATNTLGKKKKLFPELKKGNCIWSLAFREFKRKKKKTLLLNLSVLSTVQKQYCVITGVWDAVHVWVCVRVCVWVCVCLSVLESARNVGILSVLNSRCDPQVGTPRLVPTRFLNPEIESNTNFLNFSYIVWIVKTAQ